MKKLIAAAATATIVALACIPSGTRASAASDTGHVLRLVPMDSASAECLCLKPDLVRAGLADCVLKDQSPALIPLTRQPLVPVPPPPAR